MDTSIFTDKKRKPTDKDLIKALGKTYNFWQIINDYVRSKFPKGLEEWNYTSEKYGWSFKIKDKKRAILYLLPRDKFFKVAFVFGQKATDIIMKSQISCKIKKELKTTRVYTEGRGIRIDIKNETIITDIQELIDIKLAT